MIKHMEKHIANLFNEEMTSSEARTVFFEAVEGKTQEEVEQIKSAYSEVLHKITKKEFELAKDGWMF